MIKTLKTPCDLSQTGVDDALAMMDAPEFLVLTVPSQTYPRALEIASNMLLTGTGKRMHCYVKLSYDFPDDWWMLSDGKTHVLSEGA